MACVVRLHMKVIPRKAKRNGKEHYRLIDVKRVGGKTVQKCAGFQNRNSIGVDMIEYDMKPDRVFLKIN